MTLPRNRNICCLHKKIPYSKWRSLLCKLSSINPNINHLSTSTINLHGQHAIRQLQLPSARPTSHASINVFCMTHCHLTFQSMAIHLLRGLGGGWTGWAGADQTLGGGVSGELDSGHDIVFTETARPPQPSASHRTPSQRSLCRLAGQTVWIDGIDRRDSLGREGRGAA